MISVALIVFFGFIVGYFLARIRFKGSKIIWIMLLMGMLIPVHSLLVPIYVVFNRTGLSNQWFTLIIPYVAFGMPIAVFLCQSFIREVPTALEEAASIDGCSFSGTLFKVIMPICKPIMITVAILQTFSCWNEFSFALVLIKDTALQTVPLAMTQFTGQFSSDYPKIMAAMLITMAPIVVLYFAFSKQIIKGMVGRELTDRFPKREKKNIGDVALEVKNWTVHHPLYSERKVVDNVSMYVRKGEVLGISGLMGAGRTELAMSIFGKSYGKNISGQLFINGKEVHLHSVKDAIKHKLAYVTEDRKGNGLILSNPIRVNTTLANLEGVSSHGVIDNDKEIAVAEEYREKLRTKCPSVEQNVGNLSGGNQQKVLLAKWMFAGPDVLILDEPTRGIDVGAKYEIYCIINDLVAQGKSVIMISSELPEVLGMSDRIYIMNEGKMVGELSGEEATQELIMSRILKSSKGE